MRLWYVAPMYRYAAPQAGPLPRALPVRRRGDRLGGRGGRRRGDRAAGRLVPRARPAATSSCTSTRSATPPAGPPTARRSSRTSRRCATSSRAESQERLEKNPMRILDSKDERDQPFIPDAPRDHRLPLRRLPRAPRDGARAPRRRAASRTCSTTRSCAGSTTTRAPPGSGSRSPTAARRRRSRAAAATTGWPSRSAASATPGVGFGCGIERLVLALETGRAASPSERGCDWFCAVDVAAARPRVGALLDRGARRRPRRPRWISPAAA